MQTMKEKVKIVVSTRLIHQPSMWESLERFAIETIISSDGSYQAVDDEVRDFVFSEFRDWPADCIKNISWSYV